MFILPFAAMAFYLVVDIAARAIWSVLEVAINAVRDF